MALLQRVSCFRILPFSHSLTPERLFTAVALRDKTSTVAREKSEKEGVIVSKELTSPNLFFCNPTKTLRFTDSKLLVFQDGLPSFGVRGMHTSVVSDAKTKSSGSSGQQGSVLTQIVNPKEEQKQLTVGGKGGCVLMQ